MSRAEGEAEVVGGARGVGHGGVEDGLRRALGRVGGDDEQGPGREQSKVRAGGVDGSLWMYVCLFV